MALTEISNLNLNIKSSFGWHLKLNKEHNFDCECVLVKMRLKFKVVHKTF